MLAELREDFVKQSLALPIGTVERAGTGDLLTRTSRDVEALGWSVRFAVPETIIAFVTTIFTIVACVLVGAWVLVPLVLGVPVLFVATRWYLQAGQAGLPAGVGVVRRDQRQRRRDDRRCPHRRGARSRAAPAGADRRRHRRVVRRRALHAVPADGLVPVGRDRLPAADRDDAAPRRLPACSGAGRPRRRHGGDAVRPGAGRPGRPADLVARRAPGRSRRRWPGCSAWPRCPTTASRPGGRPQHEDIDADDVRFAYVDDRDVLHGVDLHVDARGAGRDGRTVRRGQVDPRSAAGRHPPAAGRLGDGRRRRDDRAAARRPARACRAGDAGAPRLRRHDARQPGPRRGRHRRGHGHGERPHARGPASGRRPRVGAGAARRTRHPGRFRWPGAVAGAGAAARAWPAWCWPTRTPWCSTRRRR